MNRYLSYLRGYYCPSFFKIGINVFEPLDNLEILPAAPKSTFFHEYIHFLQDISTTYGLINACIVVTKMKFGNQYILRKPGNKFSVPLQFTTDPTTELNSKLQELYLGFPSPSIAHLHIVDIKKELSSVFVPAPHSKYVSVVKVFYKNTINEIDFFNLGALHIMETMCHIAQKIYDPTITHRDVPYRTAELVAKHIYDVIGNNLLFVFALCEASMMHSHPADGFFEMLVQMKTDKFIPKNELEIYDFVFRNIRESGTGRTLLQIFEDQIVFTINELTGYFTTSHFDNEILWITQILNEAKKLRLKNPGFILNLLQQPELFSIELKRIMLLLGTPLMQNIDGDCWFQRPISLSHVEISPDRMAAILEIHDLWMGGKKGCELKKYCSRSLVGTTTDVRCDVSPWLRGTDPLLCAYAQFWKTWKLNGKEPDFI